MFLLSRLAYHAASIVGQRLAYVARNIAACGGLRLPAREDVTLETHFTETFVARLGLLSRG